MRQVFFRFLFFFGTAVVGYFLLNVALGMPIATLLGTMLFIVIFITVFFHMDWGVYFLIISMAQSFEIPFSGQLTIFTDDLIIFAIIFAFLVKLIALNKSWQYSKLNLPIYVLSFTAIISLLYSAFYISQADLTISFFHLLKWLEYLFIFFIVLNTIRTKQQVQTAIRTLAVVGLAAAIFSIYCKVTGYSLHQEYVIFQDGLRTTRLTGPFDSSHVLGAFMALTSLLLFTLAYESKRATWRITLFLLALLPIYPLFYSYSRGAYTGYIAGLFMLSILKRNKILFFGLLATIVFYASILPEPVVSRIGGTFSKGEFDTGSTERFDLWSRAIKLYLYHPLIGIGFWNSYSVQYLGTGPHNSFLQTLLETGAIGFLAFIAIIYRIMRDGWVYLNKKVNQLGQTVVVTTLTLLATYCTFSLTAEVFYISRINGYLWLLVGLSYVMFRLDKKENPSAS